jgi:CheY-like chemotaxis protein
LRDDVTEPVNDYDRMRMPEDNRLVGTSMGSVIQKVRMPLFLFLTLFAIAVAALYQFGQPVFLYLLGKHQAFVPPMFLTWVSLTASLCLAVAFGSLAVLLYFVIRRRRDIPFDWIIACFGSFLLFASATAFCSLLSTINHGPVVIWALVITHVATALLSVITTMLLWALLPQLLAIPSISDLVAERTRAVSAQAETEAHNKFLAIVSHELRTPLAPLLGALSELDQTMAPLAIPGTDKLLRVLRDNINHEAQLITNMLGRFEANNIVPGQATRPSQPARILLVEDHADTLAIFSRLLQRRGYQVAQATTVKDAMAAAQDDDLLICDIGLPDGNGCDIMTHLKQRGVPGIALTGLGSKEDCERYKRVGFSAILIKPVDIEQVLKTIERVTMAAAI